MSWHKFTVLGLVLTLCATLTAQTPTPSPTPTQEELDYQARLDANRKAFTDAVAAWRVAADGGDKETLRRKAQAAGDDLRIDQESGEKEALEAVIEEVALGAPKSEKQISLNGGAVTRLPLTVLQTIPVKDERSDLFGLRRDFALRRVGDDCIEAWTPGEGWFFGRDGKVLNHAAVKRKDGTGLQWFGAFLPDGRWITTDLSERDDTVYLFSRDGKQLKQLATRDMASLGSSTRKTNGLIAWARAAADGKGWILKLDDGWWIDQNQAIYVDENLKPTVLDPSDVWKICGTRRLGARYGRIPSDDGALLFSQESPWHGYGVGHYSYSVQTAHDEPGVGGGDPQPIPNAPGHWRHAFWWHGTGRVGFWPASHATFADVDHAETWFFRENGDAAGWVAAQWLADAADGKAMLFQDAENNVLTLAPDLTIQAARAFVATDAASPNAADGAALNPIVAFDDLNLGFFEKDKSLILASWPR